MKKRIAVTQRVEYIEATGERRDALSQEWTSLAESCGFLFLLLPNHLPIVHELLETWRPDGIILTGGNDLAAYGGGAPERDELEQFLIQYSAEEKIPLLGVCRGMQMILSQFGTKLQTVEGHVRVEHLLSNGDKVNSFHSWGALECQRPLIPIAWSADGVLEAVKHQEYTWMQGIMWHPERYHPMRERDIRLIREVFHL